jgi:hypothetical protein
MSNDNYRIMNTSEITWKKPRRLPRGTVENHQSSATIVYLHAEIWTRDLRDKEEEWCQLDHDNVWKMDLHALWTVFSELNVFRVPFAVVVAEE